MDAIYAGDVNAYLQAVKSQRNENPSGDVSYDEIFDLQSCIKKRDRPLSEIPAFVPISWERIPLRLHTTILDNEEDNMKQFGNTGKSEKAEVFKIVAGGSVARYVFGKSYTDDEICNKYMKSSIKIPPMEDDDIFIVKNNPSDVFSTKDRKVILEEVVSSYIKYIFKEWDVPLGNVTIMYTLQNGLLKLKQLDSYNDPFPYEIQIILRGPYQNKLAVTSGFDLPICGLYAYKTAPNKIKIAGTVEAAYAVATSVQIIPNLERRSTTFQKRIAKYFNRGIGIAFPFVDANYIQKIVDKANKNKEKTAKIEFVDFDIIIHVQYPSYKLEKNMWACELVIKNSNHMYDTVSDYDNTCLSYKYYELDRQSMYDLNVINFNKLINFAINPDKQIINQVFQGIISNQIDVENGNIISRESVLLSHQYEILKNLILLNNVQEAFSLFRERKHHKYDKKFKKYENDYIVNDDDFYKDMLTIFVKCRSNIELNQVNIKDIETKCLSSLFKIRFFTEKLKITYEELLKIGLKAISEIEKIYSSNNIKQISLIKLEKVFIPYINKFIKKITSDEIKLKVIDWWVVEDPQRQWWTASRNPAILAVENFVCNHEMLRCVESYTQCDPIVKDDNFSLLDVDEMDSKIYSQCPICLRTVCKYSPRTITLPCGHSMCLNNEECYGILGLFCSGINKFPLTTNNKLEIRCPMCRAVSDIKFQDYLPSGNGFNYLNSVKFIQPTESMQYIIKL